MISNKKILFAAIFLLLILFFINYQKKTKNSELEIVKDPIFLIEENSIDNITIEFLTGETLYFEKKDNIWSITDPVIMKADNQTFNNICESIRNLTFSKKVKLQKGNIEDFGFEFPMLSIDFSVNGKNHKLKLGDNTFNGSEMFALADSTEEIYVINGGFINKFKKDVRDYKDKVISSFKEEHIKNFIFETENITLTAQKPTSEVIYTVEKNNEKIQYQKERAEEILEYFKNLRVEQWDSLGVVDLDNYGLENPEYKVSIDLKDSKYSFSIGKRGNSAYIIKDGEYNVAKINPYFEHSVENLEIKKEKE
ncbi:MAG: DUF4340 domain-containing protein [Candidatus Muirbacterium halophilum]|nr:DUF4340 domain-containing protein [Candidatus Muirbacterium halophilum]MCK9475104.1 DUF4340 domain-containing protein [Candidatus Muirbacterium halophilum]